MISRVEFYTCMAVLCGIIFFFSYPQDNTSGDLEKTRLRMQDSLFQVQRDSALQRSLKFELAADSLQAVINRRNLDIKLIHKKYENEKKNVLLLSADSTLSLFERSVTH